MRKLKLKTSGFGSDSHSSRNYLEYCKSSSLKLVPGWGKFPEIGKDNLFEPRLRVAEALRDSDLGRFCPGSYKVLRCPDCGEKVAKATDYCGDPVFCPVCARSLAVRQGGMVYQKLKVLPGRVVGYPGFTFPEDLVEELLEGRGFTVKQFGNLLLHVVSKVLKKHFPGQGFVLGFHGWSSDEPLKKPHPHVHVLLSMAKLVGANYERVKIRNAIYTSKAGKRVLLIPARYRSKLVSGQFEEVSWWLSIEKIEAIREDYRKELQKVLGLFIPQANFWWQYFFKEEEGKFRHECNYIVRRPILDVNRYLLRLGQKSLSEEERFWLDYQLVSEGRFHRVRWYGILSNGKISDTLAVLGQKRLDGSVEGINLADLKILAGLDLDKLSEVYCWNCGSLIPEEFWLYAGKVCLDRPPDYLGLKRRWWTQYQEVII